MSEQMLSRARSWPDAGIRYEVSDLERSIVSDRIRPRLQLLGSALRENLAQLFATVHAALVPGGCFVFSIEHPIYMAPSRPGWSVDAEGRRIWPVDGYLIEDRARLLARQRRRKASSDPRHDMNLLIRSGFQVEHVEEFCPSDQQIAVRPEWPKSSTAPCSFSFVDDDQRRSRAPESGGSAITRRPNAIHPRCGRTRDCKGRATRERGSRMLSTEACFAVPRGL